MNSFVSHLRNFIGVLESLSFFLPLVWVSLITFEWHTHKRYYRKYHIEHSFFTNYKIAFNPRYLWALIISIISLLYFYVVIQFGFKANIVVIAFIFLFFVKSEFKKYSIYKYKKEVMNDNFSRSNFEYKEYAYDLKTEHGLSVILLSVVISHLLGVLVNSKEVSNFYWECFPEFAYYLSEIFKVMGGVHLVGYLCWFLFTTISIYYVMICISNPQILSNEFIEYFRLCTINKRLYAIVAPTPTDNSKTCIALRTVICKMENGLICAYIIRDEMVTRQMPFEVESFLIDINKVNFISPYDFKSALYNDEELIDTFKRDNMIKYLTCDKTWMPIDKFESAPGIKYTLPKSKYIGSRTWK